MRILSRKYEILIHRLLGLAKGDMDLVITALGLTDKFEDTVRYILVEMKKERK